MEKRFQIQDREAGNVIEDKLTIDEAKLMIAQYEEQDKSEGTFVENFYEFVPMPIDKNDFEVFEFNGGYFGICMKGNNGADCVLGGDSANEDDYNRAYIESAFEQWDGSLNEEGHIEL